MTEPTQLSDKELSEALNFHRRQRNLSRGVNEAHHMRQTQMVRILEAEEARRLDELSKKTLGSYVKKASTDQYLKGQAVQYHANKANDSKGSAFEKESKKKHMNAADDALRKASNRDTGIGRAVDRLTKEEVEQIDEISTDLKNKYMDKAVADHTRLTKSWSTSSDKQGVVNKMLKRSTGVLRAQGVNMKQLKTNEEVEIDEAASYRDRGYANMLKADRKAEKELAKLRAQQAKDAAKKASKPEEFKEESNLRITKVYNKWPKPATYAVHNADRSYHKEFDSMEAAQAHKAEKSK